MPRLRAVILALLAGCGSSARDPRPMPAVAPVPAAAAPVKVAFAPLGPAPTLVRDVDGLPILDVKPPPAGAPGALRWLGATDAVLQYTDSEASDGGRVYAAMNHDGRDLIVRDGVLTEDVLAARGALAGGCVAARDGALYLAAPAVTDRDQQVRTRLASGAFVDSVEKVHAQVVWTIAADGTETRQELPSGTEDRCWLVPGDGGRFALGGFQLTTWNGSAFVEDEGKMGARITLGRIGGPAYCFESCNAAELAANPSATARLIAAVGCSDAGWIAHDDRVAGACNGRALRYRESGTIETAPIPATAMNGSYDLAFTDRGDLVIGLDYGFARYAVWRDGSKAPGPVRTLATGEVIAKASPTVHVRGLGGAAPPATVAAVVLGKAIGYGANGGTYGYRGIDRGIAAPYAKQVERARAVLGGTGPLIVAHEAVIDRTCGAFVRSPVGWEDELIDDWVPPILPALSPAAVTRPASCTPLDDVIAVPGDPDLLLARRGDQLLAAWLPPALPLPGGRDPRTGRDSPGAPQHPQPGIAWFAVGRAGATTLLDDANPAQAPARGAGSLVGLAGVAAPGHDTAVADHAWAAGGAAIITVDDATILLTPVGAVTIPPATVPMAIGTDRGLRVWGAIGPRLVDCAATCRILELGAAAELVAVVPRGDTELILGFADGRVAAYTVPATGGTAVARHPLADALDAALARRP